MNIQKLNSIEDELVYLRKNTGFTLARFEDLITLPEVLGGKNLSFLQHKAKFIIAINMLGDKQSINCLLAAYGLKEGFDSIPLLKNRRKRYCTEHCLDRDRILYLERAAIKSLAKLLYTFDNDPMRLPNGYEQILSEAIKVYIVFEK